MNTVRGLGVTQRKHQRPGIASNACVPTQQCRPNETNDQYEGVGCHKGFASHDPAP